MTTKKKAAKKKVSAAKKPISKEAMPLQEKVVEQHVEDTLTPRPLGYDEPLNKDLDVKKGNAFTRFFSSNSEDS